MQQMASAYGLLQPRGAPASGQAGAGPYVQQVGQALWSTGTTALSLGQCKISHNSAQELHSAMVHRRNCIVTWAMQDQSQVSQRVAQCKQGVACARCCFMYNLWQLDAACRPSFAMS